MAQSYTATREMLCSEETEIQVSVQWKYTVTPGCAQTLTQPEEDASLDISRVRVSWGDYKSGSYCWHENPALVDLATEVFGGDEAVEAWLMEQANESAEAARDDAADHKRQMQREDAQ